jgi:hypothetical protein
VGRQEGKDLEQDHEAFSSSLHVSNFMDMGLHVSGPVDDLVPIKECPKSLQDRLANLLNDHCKKQCIPDARVDVYYCINNAVSVSIQLF